MLFGHAAAGGDREQGVLHAVSHEGGDAGDRDPGICESAPALFQGCRVQELPADAQDSHPGVGCGARGGRAREHVPDKRNDAEREKLERMQEPVSDHEFGGGVSVSGAGDSGSPECDAETVVRQGGCKGQEFEIAVTRSSLWGAAA